MRELDLLNENSLRNLIKKFQPDVICHLAAQAGVRYKP